MEAGHVTSILISDWPGPGSRGGAGPARLVQQGGEGAAGGGVPAGDHQAPDGHRGGGDGDRQARGELHREPQAGDHLDPGRGGAGQLPPRADQGAGEQDHAAADQPQHRHGGRVQARRGERDSVVTLLV